MVAPALTILLSSFLLFLVQPILAKQILPWFGGSASVWTVCLVFFQAVLVLGYAYAHWLTRRGAGARQFVVHSSLLLASCLMLPIVPAAFWKQAHESAPAATILGLLATTVGVPYFLLASTAPLLQKWLAKGPGGAALGPSIYRLFALSNFGSLIGLLCYPFAVEPFAPLRTQAWLWSSAYVLFVISSTRYAWARRREVGLRDDGSDGSDGQAAKSATSLGRHVYWVGCSALGSTLLLSATNQITQNVAAVPLLWIVPLALYLLSFTICFEGRSGRGWYERRYWVTPAMWAAGTMAWALSVANLSVYFALPLYAVGVFLGCVMCHGELARTKPPTEHLTHFYLSLAAGGALGGMLVGLVAPVVFSGYWEMPLAVAALAVLGVYCTTEERRRRPHTPWMLNAALALLGTSLILLLLGGLPRALDPYTAPWAKVVEGEARWGCTALLFVCSLLLQRYRLWRVVSLTALLCALAFGWRSYQDASAGAEFATRNFYGALRVIESPSGDGPMRRLVHGTIVHGLQLRRLGQRETPTTYYGFSSGIGRTLSSAYLRNGPLRIGSVGLGAGTLAAYGHPGDLFQAYEINPAVLDIARKQFTYLSDSKARIELVLGDGRLSLESELARGEFDAAELRFDVLSLDAFSGDAIPVHLLTREAFATYARVTKPDGVIAFHVSNRYLNLAPVVGRVARDAGYEAVLVSDRPPAGLQSPSDWVIVTRNTGFLRQPDIASHTTALAVGARAPLWTDQFTNLLQVLK
jgi:SAM-dependent methyltransferase